MSKEEIFHYVELKKILKQKIPEEQLMVFLVSLELKKDKLEFVNLCLENKIKLSKRFYNIFVLFCDNLDEVRWVKEQAIDRQYKRQNLFHNIYVVQIYLTDNAAEAKLSYR